MMRNMSAGPQIRPKDVAPVEAVRESAGITPRILGIDPGLQRTGYAVLSAIQGRFEATLMEAGVIRLMPRDALPDRLVELEQNIAMLIEQHRPTVLACEELYAHYKHPRTAILMGHARGVVLALAARRGMTIVNLPSTRVKKTLTGNGHASKVQIQRAVAATLRLATLPEPHDVSDAIAIALCGLRIAAAEKSVRTARRVAGGVDGFNGDERS